MGGSSKRLRISATVQKTQNEILRKAMKPILGAPASVMIASMALARRSAKDLESALSALSPTLTNSRKETGARKDHPQPRLEVDTSSLAVSLFPADVKSGNFANTLSKAETLLLNARRKQGILLGLIIGIQACWRRHIIRRKYIQFRGALIQLQQRFLKSPRTIREVAERKDFQMHLVAATIQRYFRRYFVQRELTRKLLAATLIQRHRRGRVARVKYLTLRRAVIVAQKVTRMRRITHLFTLTKDLVSRVQSHVRGMQVRRRVEVIMGRRQVIFSRQIFRLWHTTHTSLAFRTKFWPTIAVSWGFLHLRVAESELCRLWELLHVPVNLQALNGKTWDDEALNLGDLLGFNNVTYLWCLHMGEIIEGKHVFDASTVKVKTALDVETAERLQIYERLSLTAHDTLVKLNKDFEIPKNEDKKKLQLAHCICTSVSWAGVSAFALSSCRHLIVALLFAP
jgi:hypothetical protein